MPFQADWVTRRLQKDKKVAPKTEFESSTQNENRSKRKIPEPMELGEETTVAQPTELQSKQKTNTTTPTQEITKGSKKDVGCLVKVYDESSGLKLNETVEFIGILYWTPHLTQFSSKEYVDFVISIYIPETKLMSFGMKKIYL